MECLYGGAAVIMLSIISKGAVGMGDGLLFLSLGTVLSFETFVSIFIGTFLLLFLGDCGVISVGKREKRLRCLSFHFLCWDILEV